MSRRLRNVFSAITIGIILVATTPSDSFGAPSGSAWPEDPSINVPICVAANNQTIGTPISDGAGGAYVLWEDRRAGTTLSALYVQHIDAAGRLLWTTDGITISSIGTKQRWPSGTPDGTGGAIIVWMNIQAEGTQLMAQRINGKGENLWQLNGIQLTTTSVERWTPSACHDGTGGMIVTWYEAQGDTDITIYAQRVDSLGNIQWTPGGIIVCNAENGQVEPRAIPDGVGGAIIQWIDFRNATFQLYCQRIDQNGQALWQTNGISVFPSSDHQYSPAITGTQDGGVVIVWHDFFIDPAIPDEWESDILAQRVDSLGNLVWGEEGLSVCTADYNQYRPSVARDSGGGFFIAWYDYRSSEFADIYAQHISADGQISWQQDGMVVCNAQYIQQRPILLEDGMNGVFVTWEDNRSDTKDIYWQHIRNNGDMDLPANGALLTSAANDQFNARLLGTSAGGAIVVWEDYRDGTTDKNVYADRILIPNPQATWGFWIGANSQYDQAFPLYLGVHPTALNELDPLDVQIPSITNIGKPLVWSEVIQDIDTIALIQNIRYDGSPAQRWIVDCSLGSEILNTTLVIAAERIPSGLRAVIYGLDSEYVQEVGSSPTLIFSPEQSGTIKKFQLIIGDTLKPFVQVIAPNGGEELPPGVETTIQWNVSDSSGILKQYIYYHPFPGQPSILIDSLAGYQTSYTWIPQIATFTGKISIAVVDSILNFAVDSSDNYFSVVSKDSISFTLRQQWNLISIPMLQKSMSVAAVLGDDFGATPVQIFKYEKNTGKYVAVSDLSLGIGYWLYSYTSTQVIDVSGISMTTFLMPLPRGWNLIGSPFPVPFHISNIYFRKGAERKVFLDAIIAHWIDAAFYGYNGSGYVKASDQLEPWLGYWFYTMADDIYIDFDVSLAKSAIINAENQETDQKQDWSEHISASLSTDVRTVYDDVAVFGSASKATSSYDGSYDVPRLPRVPDSLFVELSFLTENDGVELLRDIRSFDNSRWPLSVKTSHTGSVTLRWDAEKLKAVKHLHSCSLIDAASGTHINMFVQSSYTYIQTSKQQSFEIQIYSTAKDEQVPSEFALLQNYPNPFNPSTQIKFSLAAASAIRLQLFDILGRDIKTLASGVYQSGSHVLTLDASTLPSGIYMYRLQAGDFTATRKLVLLK